MMNTRSTIALPDGMAGAITREEMAKLPIRRYEGDVCMAAGPQDLQRALVDFRQESVVGLDTETRPAFRKGETHLPCLVQVATARVAYLFRLQGAELIAVLTE